MNEITETVEAMDEKIVAFLHSQTNMTIAVSDDNSPYCANCFYAFSEKENLLFFKSKPETTHIKIALKNNNIAGTILPNSMDKTRIQGIQFTGKFIQLDDDFFSSAKLIYYKKFPFAMPISGELWAIELVSIKFTDNKLGFGKRLEWKNRKSFY
jgi:uncharacterized protein YhbP (UPF0306 family)